MKVEFFKHSIGEAELEGIKEVFATPFLTSGPKTQEFEAAFSNYLSVPYALGVTSCTTGLFLALKVFDIGPGDEVIVPAMTFIATANVVLHCGATPVMVDVDADTGLISPEKVETAITKKTKAIIPVHLYGQLADMKALKALADKHNLIIIEDAAHAIESKREDYKTGQLGDAAAFSFYATKNITCGDGGALTLQSEEAYNKVKTLRLHGMSKSAADRYHNKYQHWDMVDLGYKFNLTDIQSAMLLPQLKSIDIQRAKRAAICNIYETHFKEHGVEFPIVLNNSQSARHLFTIFAPLGTRDKFLFLLQEANIGVAVNYRAIHLLSYYKEKFGYTSGTFPNAENIGDRTITLPLYPGLTQGETEYVCKKVVEIQNKLRG